MKKYFMTAAAALMLTGFAATAQESGDNVPDAPEAGKNELGEYDEIVIKRKRGEKDTKVTIEIKEDKVFVDGKPIDAYSDEDLSVRKREINRYRMTTPMSRFRLDDGDWMMENNKMGEDVAFLGVMTDGSSGGAKVSRVTENSAAAKAGLQTGDVITKINDKAVYDHEQLSDIISELKPGDKVDITYKRNDKEQKTTATLGKRKLVNRTIPRVPNAPHPPMTFNFDGENFEHMFDMRGNKPRLGLRVQDTEDGKGVKVLEVEDGSAAEKAGIKEDDIIIAFDGADVKSAPELVKASREAKDKPAVKIQLKRNGKSQTVEVKVPRKLKTANL